MMKRIFDLLFAVLGVILLFPILIIISCIIKLTSKGSAFFIQERVGKEGKTFRMIKFRSMHVVNKSYSTISVKGDIRITKIGAVLRRYNWMNCQGYGMY